MTTAVDHDQIVVSSVRPRPLMKSMMLVASRCCCVGAGRRLLMRLTLSLMSSPAVAVIARSRCCRVRVRATVDLLLVVMHLRSFENVEVVIHALFSLLLRVELLLLLLGQLCKMNHFRTTAVVVGVFEHLAGIKVVVAQTGRRVFLE